MLHISKTYMIELARDHWKEWFPKKYQDLKLRNTLETALEQAADQTLAEMKELMSAGMMASEAWPEVRETYLLITPEREVEKESDNEALDLLYDAMSLKNSAQRHLQKVI